MRFITSADEPPFLIDFLTDLHLISENHNIKKVFFLVDRIEFGLSELENIADGISKIRKSGKITAGFCETGDIKSIYLLSAMDERYTSESGEFQSILPSAESFFFGKLAKKAGIGVESFASGKYKSFAETFSRDSFSKEAKENISALITSIRSQLIEQIEKNSPLTEKILQTPVIPAVFLKTAGFFHDFTDSEAFSEHFTSENFSDPFADLKSGSKKDIVKKVKTFKKAKLSHVYFFQNKKKFRFFRGRISRIVILPLKGTINQGKKEDTEIKSGSINAYPLVTILRTLRVDKSVKGVILEIDSGGGSAYASELIYKEILKLKKEKKVYAYFQNTAASGGYYLAAGCDRIFSDRFCITGSIGAIMIRPDLKGLYDKLGITKERVGFYPLRDIYSEYGKLKDDSKKFLQKEIDRIKTQFYERVSLSRNKKGPDLERLAGGRVFSGEDFFKSGMVDQIGSILDTVKSLKDDLKLKEIFLSYEPALYSVRSFIQDFKFAMSLMNEPEKILKSKLADSHSEIEYRLPIEFKF